jgi:hypothetical protein
MRSLYENGSKIQKFGSSVDRGRLFEFLLRHSRLGRSLASTRKQTPMFKLLKERAALQRIYLYGILGLHDTVVDAALPLLNVNSPELFNELVPLIRKHLRPDHPRAAEFERYFGGLRLQYATQCAQRPGAEDDARQICESIVARHRDPELVDRAAQILNQLGPDMGPHYWHTTDAIGMCMRLEDIKDPRERQHQRALSLQKQCDWRTRSLAEGKALYARIHAAPASSPLPFLLYLRSFSAEAESLEYASGSEPLFEALKKSGLADLQYTTVVHVQRPFERWLKSATDGRKPVLAIMNPREAGTSTLAFPFLEATNDSWKALVIELIAKATVIVQYAQRLTEGVQFELKTAAAIGRIPNMLLVAAADGLSVSEWREALAQDFPQTLPAIVAVDDVFHVTLLEDVLPTRLTQ